MIPVLPVLALLVRRYGGKGPVLLRQERMTLDGKTFQIFKFRTMVDEAEKDTGPIFATSDDPRRTPIGAWLRKHNLDELPQLLNVLLGDMSLVGPRPERPPFVQQFRERIPQYMRRHRVKSGMTGWAQVNGWRGNTSIEKRIEFDLYYIENWSLRLDLKILILTLFHGFGQDHAYGLPCPAQRRSPVMPQLLVTGAAGFIGSHLSEYLLERGFSVIGMDNLITGDVANVEHLTGRDFVLVEHNVTSYIAVKGPLDYIFHFASPASPVDYLRIPIQTLKVGALGTHNALGLAKAKGARLLLASTSEVYGDPLVHPQREDYWGNVNPIGPRGVYDEAKRFAEAITMAYHRFHGVETRIVRIFNTYGPRMRVEDGRAIPAFMSQALRGEDVTVFGDGSQTRSLCYVSDLVEGIFRLMMSDVTRPREHRQPAGAHDPRARGARGGARRLEVEDRRAAAAGRRPQGAPAGHHARPDAARLGAQGPARGGPAADARLLPPQARASADAGGTAED